MYVNEKDFEVFIMAYIKWLDETICKVTREPMIMSRSVLVAHSTLPRFAQRAFGILREDMSFLYSGPYGQYTESLLSQLLRSGSRYSSLI